ncbi:MAG: ATP phosphoribosyltransferase regulatory subunit, partial [Candidatus Poribacteria bacterium]|nr:ATP phosphoribosyltransferase regulatory subunit [Candidatus Poribacteria bacterium]
RVWRGERPQDGRYREFYQGDIDVINVDGLPLHFDAEMPAIIYDTLRSLDIGEIQIRISNRKILEGYFTGLGIEDTVSAIRIVDKLDKIGGDEVASTLQSEFNLSPELVQRCLAIATIHATDASFVEQVEALEVQSDLLDEGLNELVFVMEELGMLIRGGVLADLSIARGFDYYTGSVYETMLLDFPNLGSICSGGRYDDLAGSFINRKLPGVGISIGLSRLFGKLIGENRLETGPSCPTDVLTVFPNADQREASIHTANILRQRGFNVEMYHAPGKISRQLRYASRKGIPYVWFPPFEAGGAHEVKDMSSGEQMVADPELWHPGE